MALASDSNNELKHLLPKICVMVENSTINSPIWGIEEAESQVGYRAQKKSFSKQDKEVTFFASNWIISQEKETCEKSYPFDVTTPLTLSINYDKLSYKFNFELRKIKSDYPFSHSDIVQHFYKTANKLAGIDFTDAIVEITGYNSSIKYTLIFPENKTLMISSPIGGDSKQVVYSFFVNRELISTNAMELSSLIEGFNKYLQS